LFYLFIFLLDFIFYIFFIVMDTCWLPIGCDVAN
jgi:hypothetical protein